MKRYDFILNALKDHSIANDEIEWMILKYLFRFRGDPYEFLNHVLQIATQCNRVEMCQFILDHNPCGGRSLIDPLVLGQVQTVDLARLFLTLPNQVVRTSPYIVYNILDKPLEIVQYVVFKLGVREAQSGISTTTEVALLGPQLAKESTRLESTIPKVNFNSNRAISVLVHNPDARVLRFLGELFGLDLETHGPRLLMSAARFGYIDVAKFLLNTRMVHLKTYGLRWIPDKGAGFVEDHSPLLVAAQFGHVDIVNLLTRTTGRLDPMCLQNTFATAAVHGRLAVMSLLVNNFAITKSILTRALARSVEVNQLESVMFLVDVCRIDVSLRQRGAIGPKMIELSVLNRKPKILKFLVQRGARITNRRRFSSLLQKSSLDKYFKIQQISSGGKYVFKPKTLRHKTRILKTDLEMVRVLSDSWQSKDKIIKSPDDTDSVAHSPAFCCIDTDLESITGHQTSAEDGE